MKIYNILIKREIIDLTDDGNDEDRRSNNAVNTREEIVRNNDAKRCRSENNESKG